MSFMNRFFSIRLEENDETIIIKNINGRALSKFISNFWKTSVIDKFMFKRVSTSYIEFYKFFAIDVLYILERLSTKRSSQIPARTLHQMAELLKTESWLKDVYDEAKVFKGRLDYSRLKELKYQPLPYQAQWFDYYNNTLDRYQLKGSVVGAAPGAGKTYMSYATAHMLNEDKVVICCPKIAIEKVWETEINNIFKSVPKYWTSKMNTDPDPDTKYYIYHYEALDRAYRDLAPFIGKMRFTMIADESHNLNDIKSQRTQNWVNLCKQLNANNVIHASGTPLKALGVECIPLLRIVDKYFTPQAEERFRKIFGISGKRGLDILRNRLGIVSFTVKKEELGLKEPEMITLPVKIPEGSKYTLTAVREKMREYLIERAKYYANRAEEDMAFYKACLEVHESKLKNERERQEFQRYQDFVRRIQRTTEYKLVPQEIKYCKQYEFYTISKSLDQKDVRPFRSVCSVIKYLPLKLQGEVLGNVVGKMRIEAHVKMCKGIPFYDISESTKKKTVVFTSFVDVLSEVERVCKDEKLVPVVVYGKTSNNIASIVNQFGQDESINPLIATYDSLSTAVPLTMADTMIMVNAPFRAYIQEQAISRIHRLNQDSQVRIYQCYLDTGNEANISSRSLDIMKWSQEQVEEMTGVKSPYALDDTSEGEIKVSTEGLDTELNYTLKYEPEKETLYSVRFTW